MRFRSSLLWIDSCAGLSVGALVLSLSPWLSTLYGLPLSLVLVMGCANLAYGIFSFTLARRATRPLRLIVLLAGANATWAVACFVTAALVAREATLFGIATLVFEGVFVGGLAALEWRHRVLLSKGAEGRVATV